MRAFWPHVLWTFSSLRLLACVPITQAYSARLSLQTEPPSHLMCLPDVSFPGTKNKHGWPMAFAWMEAGARETETRNLYFLVVLKCKFLNCLFRAVLCKKAQMRFPYFLLVVYAASGWDGHRGSRQRQFLRSHRQSLHPELVAIGAGDHCPVSLLWSVFAQGLLLFFSLSISECVWTQTHASFFSIAWL